jgi:hypothetical protein
MSYNNETLPRYVRTAGKITVLTAITGLLVFIAAFIFDVGTQELNKVSAQSATTSLSVLNTPPVFTLNPYEVIGSSTSTPTNSGEVLQWSAIGSDPNLANYYLLVCSVNASPTPNSSDAPDCGGGIQWGVSASTASDALATVSTTTEEWGTGQFTELNTWYAWLCDGAATNPRCSIYPEQGDYATSSSPFQVNNRPVITDFNNNGPSNPSDIIVFHSTSSDPDSAGGENSIYLVVCNSNSDYNTTTNTCPNDFIASTTITFLSDATATYTLPAIIRDDSYSAYGYIVDEFGHEALGNGINQDFEVGNVAPTVTSGNITLNGGLDLVLTIEAGETPSSTLDFTIRDANSCLTAASTTDEIKNFTVAIFRSSIGSSTCDGTSGSYDPNNCYSSGVPTTTWNLTCSATTTCASPLQDYMGYSCNFPLWFVADPTDAGTPWTSDSWSAAVAGSDDDFATSTLATSTLNVDLLSFNAIDILAAEIAYGGVEPGSDTSTLIATSTLLNIGNTGLDQESQGESMCGTFTIGTECAPSATSTIPESEQQFSSTTLAYGSPLAITLSSTTALQVELDVLKTTSTTTYSTGVTFWGIAVPATISLSGSYTGLNTFTAVTAEIVDWTP